jgi:hypothetical protein
VKYILPVLVFVLTGCSQKLQVPENPKPAWLSAKPFPGGYYTGIGHSIKDGNSNYIQVAKKSALEDLVSEIKVMVSSTSVLSQIDVDKQFHERYEQIIQTEAADEIQEFELVDAWEDVNNYWVYYRLSKERYREIKEEQKRNAVILATDYYKKGLDADKKGDRVQAASFYFQAFRSVEKYLADPIRIVVEDREILLTNEIYASIQSLLDRINLRLDPSEIQLNRRMNDNQQTTVLARATYKDVVLQAKDLPLTASFEKGQGVVFPQYRTNELGEAKILLTKIGSRELEQTVGVKVDIETLAGSSESPIFSLIAKSLNVPYAQVVLKVQRPVVYITMEEKSFGFQNNYALIGNKLKNFLARSGFEFTEDKQVADLLIDVRSDTERGSISGSIYITYLTGVIRVSSGKAGHEIYATTLDRIKGYGLDYDRSSVDAYNKTVETLEKERMNELLDTVLQ